MINRNSLLAKILTLSVITTQVGIAAVSSTTELYGEKALKSKYASWGINPDYKASSIQLKESWKSFQKQEDVLVAVVDTGIQFNHPFLKDNLYNIKGKATASDYGVDFSKDKDSNSPKDSHGHGTHVAGIIKSVYPEVKILALKYYNPMASGHANLTSTIKALKYAVDNNVAIINYSGGGPEPSSAEKKVLEEAEKKGILVIAAAGNEKSNIDIKKNAYYPASYGLSNIITVGAHDEMNKVIASSNWGSKSVDIAAPGFRIKSALPGNGAGMMTGTSQATAFVTGVASLIKSNYPKLNYIQIKNIILSSSMKVANFKGKILGSGKLNAHRALEVAKNVHERLYAPSRTVARKNQ